MGERKGLPIHIYRSNALGTGADFSLNGISARHDKLTITGIVKPGVGREPAFQELGRMSQVFSPTDDAPEAWFHARQLGGSAATWSIIPAMPDNHPGGLRSWVTRFMFGGNYAGASDSRLCRVFGFYGAVAIHDRCEH